MGHDPACGSNQKVSENSRVGLGWVGSGRVNRCSKSRGSGRVGVDQEVSESHGSGRVILTRSDPLEEIRPVKSPLTFTFGSNPPKVGNRKHAIYHPEWQSCVILTYTPPDLLLCCTNQAPPKPAGCSLIIYYLLL